MSGLDILRAISAAAWIVCIACLTPAVARLMRGRGRYLDPIWAIVFLLSFNRLSFLLRISAEGSHVTAAMLAIAMAGFSIWYQRHDR